MNGSDAIVILQARMGSTRLPGKALAEVGGFTILERCIRRLQAARVGQVIVATTTLPGDDEIAHHAAALGASIARGSNDDVLGRFAQAVRDWTGAYVFRATADNPFVDIDAGGRLLQWLRQGADYALEKALPVGAAVEGMTTASLRTADREAVDGYDREHVTPWIRRASPRFTVRDAEAPSALARSDLRFTIDTASDLVYARALVAAAGSDPLIPLAALIAAADRLAVRAAAEGTPDARPGEVA